MYLMLHYSLSGGFLSNAKLSITKGRYNDLLLIHGCVENIICFVSICWLNSIKTPVCFLGGLPKEQYNTEIVALTTNLSKALLGVMPLHLKCIMLLRTIYLFTHQNVMSVECMMK